MFHLEIKFSTACPSQMILQPLPDCLRQLVLEKNKPTMMSVINYNEPSDFFGSLVVHAWCSRNERSLWVVSYNKSNTAAFTSESAAEFLIDTNPKPRRTLMTV
jgi:hypothetical protein